MSKRDFYDVLGVPRTADQRAIKKAFRRLAQQYHPDVNKEPSAGDRFKEINEAYQVLSDAEKRAAYDRFGHAAFEAGGGMGGYSARDFSGFSGNMTEIFEEFFGGGRRRNGPRRGADLRYDLRITFEEAAFGAEKEIEITRPAVCDVCNGTGSEPGSSPIKCTTCKGSGEVRRVQQSILGSFVNVGTCPTCNGSGEMIVNPCRACNGRKQIQQTKKLLVNIPAGVDDGMQVRRTGEGGPGVNGGPAGNLYVVISVRKHEFFQRNGDDIYLEMDINVAQAVLGDEIEVPTLGDSSDMLVIPPGTQSGTKFTLRGRGVTRLQRNSRGDQHVIVRVNIPKKLSEKQVALFEELATTLSDRAVVSQRDKGFLSGLKDSLGEMFGF